MNMDGHLNNRNVYIYSKLLQLKASCVPLESKAAMSRADFTNPMLHTAELPLKNPRLLDPCWKAQRRLTSQIHVMQAWRTGSL